MGKIIITTNRESGSGGRKIAFRLGELLGIKVYDKAAIEGIKTYKPENKKITSREAYYAQTQKMREIAANESCIFVGRTRFRIFKDDPNALKIFIFADRNVRIKKMAVLPHARITTESHSVSVGKRDNEYLFFS